MRRRFGRRNSGEQRQYSVIQPATQCRRMYLVPTHLRSLCGSHCLPTVCCPACRETTCLPCPSMDTSIHTGINTTRRWEKPKEGHTDNGLNGADFTVVTAQERGPCSRRIKLRGLYTYPDHNPLLWACAALPEFSVLPCAYQHAEFTAIPPMLIRS